MNLPFFSLKNKTLILLSLAILTVWGVWNYLHISKREDPEIKVLLAMVVTIWPGAGAQQVEELVTRELEDRIEQMNSVVKLRSTSREAISVIEVTVDYNADADMAWQKLRNKVNGAVAQLPEGIIGPDVVDDFGDVTAMIYSLSSSEATPRELENYAKELKARISHLDDVGKIDLLGVQEEAIYIEGPLESFTMYEFSALQLAQILDAQNLNTPAGYLRSEERNYRLAPSGAFEIVNQIEEAVIDVSRESGAPLKVKDVFSVRQGYREPSLEMMKTDGNPSVGLDIRMKKGRNVVAMGERVREVAEKYVDSLPSHVKLTLVHDQPREVETFIGDFMENLFEGLVLVVLVLLVFMGVRAAGIIAVGLPLCILFTFAAMPLLDVDLETVSIASFIIALGMLVDNAIIVLDNIYVHIQRGEGKFEAAWKGVQELKVSLFIGTLGTVFAFLPLLILGGEVGAYTRSLPIVVSVSLMASLLLAVTLTPILCVWWARAPKKFRKKKDGDSVWKKKYERFLSMGMRWRFVVIALALASLLGAVALLPEVGMSFFPEAHRDQFVIDVWLPEGASLQRTEKVAGEVTDELNADNRVLHHASYLGKGGPRFFISVDPEFNTPNYAQFLVTTKSPDATDELVPELSGRLREKIVGARINVKKLVMGIPVEAPVALRITGPDLRISRQISAQVQEIVRKIPGARSIRDNLGEPVASYRVNLDAQAAAMYGLTSTEIALSLLMAYDGLPVTDLRKDGKEIPVYLRMTEADRTFENTLHLLRIPSSATAGKVPLSAFSDIQVQWSPGVVKRFNSQRSVTVLADLKEGVLADDVMQQLYPKLETMTLPPGYEITSAGEDAERSDAFGDLLVAFALIIVALLFLLVVQFKSLKKALVILFSVPLAVIGAILGLYFSGNTFSFMAFLGLISLAGMVIKNSVVWMEFVDSALAVGTPLKQAIIQAGYARFRPIMLTAGTTIGGLFPLALFGGSLWEGMVWAMIAGLGFATVLTLIVIPIIYYAFMKGAKAPGLTAGVVAVILLTGVLSVPGTALADEHPLTAYLQEAKKHSLTVKQSAQDVALSDEKVAEARSTFVPTLELQASATVLDREQKLKIDLSDAELPFPVELPAMTLANKYIYQLSGRVTVPIYTGGRRIAGYRAAMAAEEMQRDIHQATVDEVMLGTVIYYISMLESHYRVKIYQEAQTVDRALVAAQEAMLAEEMGTPLDISMAGTQAADSERRLVLAKRELTQKKLQFNELIGRALDAPVILQDIGLSSSAPASFHRPAQSSVVEKLPQIRAMKKGIAAMEHQVDMARGDLLPQLAIIGEGGYRHGDLGYVDGDDYWMATAVITWQPLTDVGAWTRLRQKRIEKRRMEIELQDERRKKVLAIRMAEVQLRDTLKILDVATRALKTAADARQNATMAYEEGVLPIYQLSETSRKYYEARENYLKAYFGTASAEVLLRFRSGKPVMNRENMRGQSPFAHVDDMMTMEANPGN